MAEVYSSSIKGFARRRAMTLSLPAAAAFMPATTMPANAASYRAEPTSAFVSRGASVGIEAQFNRHRDAWLSSGVQLFSSPSDIYDHPAFLAILAMGQAAVPFMLRELEGDSPRLWLWPLHVASVGVDPIDRSQNPSQGDVVKAWFDWGRQMGHVA